MHVCAYHLSKKVSPLRGLSFIFLHSMLPYYHPTPGAATNTPMIANIPKEAILIMGVEQSTFGFFGSIWNSPGRGGSLVDSLSNANESSPGRGDTFSIKKIK